MAERDAVDLVMDLIELRVSCEIAREQAAALGLAEVAAVVATALGQVEAALEQARRAREREAQAGAREAVDETAVDEAEALV